MEEDDRPDILSRVKQINTDISALEKEREQLQDACSHKESHIAFDETKSVKKYCSICTKLIGYPSKSESDAFLGIN